MHPKYAGTLPQVITWARETPSIQGLILIGSQARSTVLPDQWSDMDLMVIADDPQALLSDTTWFARFGQVACFFAEIVPLHFTSWRWIVRRVLYSDQRDIDFSLLPFSQQAEVLFVNKDILSKGWRVLYDANGTQLAAQIGELMRVVEHEAQPLPAPEKLREVVSELLYHVIWAYKKIRRQELWVAAVCINCHMKDLLLWLIEAHITTIGQRQNPLKYGGRFLEQRIEPAVRDRLAGCFTRYDAREATAALQNIFDLTRGLSYDICQHNGCVFDAAQFESIRAMFDELQSSAPADRE